MPWPRHLAPASIMYTFVCSGHGHWKRAYGKFTIPGNVYMIFWVYHGEVLTAGTSIENLILKTSDKRWERQAQTGYMKDPRKLDPAQFNAPVNAARVGSQIRYDLPEVIRPYGECYDYRLSYHPEATFYVNVAKTTLLTQEGIDYPADNVITPQPAKNFLRPEESDYLPLHEILNDLSARRPSEAIQVHWSACRAIDESL